MPSALEVAKQANKTYGVGTVEKGVRTHNSPRIPTGAFELDLALGGGIPMGRFTEIYGPESSGKTNLVLSLIRQAQHLYPDKYVVFFDAEGGLVGSWLKAWGIDTDRLLVINPDYAESIVDMAQKFIEADDVCMVVIDSLAAMTMTAEIEKSAEGAIVAGASMLIKKLMKKCGQAQNSRRKAFENGEVAIPPPALVCINQIMTKVGVMFGNPETTPGGHAPKFWAALRLRLYGKNVVDKKVSDIMPVCKATNVVIQKWKVPITAISADYEMVMVPHDGLGVGATKDWNFVEKAMRERGWLVKSKNSWLMFEEPYGTLLECRDRYYTDIDFKSKVRELLMITAKQETDLSAEGELPDEEESATQGPALPAHDPVTGEILD